MLQAAERPFSAFPARSVGTSNDAPMPDSDPISLDELAKAFAQVMGALPQCDAGVPPASAAETAAPQDPAAEAAAGLDETQPKPPHEPTPALYDSAEDAGPVTPLSILEAMLFVGDRGNQPLTAAVPPN